MVLKSLDICGKMPEQTWKSILDGLKADYVSLQGETHSCLRTMRKRVIIMFMYELLVTLSFYELLRQKYYVDGLFLSTVYNHFTAYIKPHVL